MTDLIAHSETEMPASRAIDVEKRISRAASRRRWLEFVGGIVTPLALLGAWEIASRTGALDVRLFSRPTLVIARAWDLMRDGTLASDSLATLRRLLVGYFFGAVVGVVMGLLLGTSTTLRAIFGPTISALYAVPKIAVFPMLLLLFGLGDVPLYIMVFTGVVFPVFIATESGVRTIDAQVLEAGKSCGATGFTFFLRVVLPGSLSSTFAGLRTAAGLATVVVIAAEFVSSNDGLGQLIWNSWTLLQPDPMFVGIVTVAIMGTLFMQLVVVVERILIPWNNPPKRRRKR